MNTVKRKKPETLGERFKRLLGDLIDALQDENRKLIDAPKDENGKVVSPDRLKCPFGDLNQMYVRFYTKRGRLITNEPSVTQALLWLHCGIYHFEEYDLDEADGLEVYFS
jgi:hypothetical protein